MGLKNSKIECFSDFFSFKRRLELSEFFTRKKINLEVPTFALKNHLEIFFFRNFRSFEILSALWKL